MNTLQWGPVESTGTSLRAMFSPLPFTFEETVARLITASGQPVHTPDKYKVSVQFTGTFKDAVFTLYDYKEDRELHIGGLPGLDVAGLQAAITEALVNTTPTPYRAREFYDVCKGHLFSGVHAVVQAMLKYGGSFVQALARAFQAADGDNRTRIRLAWPEYWARYTEMAQLAPEERGRQ